MTLLKNRNTVSPNEQTQNIWETAEGIQYSPEFVCGSDMLQLKKVLFLPFIRVQIEPLYIGRCGVTPVPER